MTRPTLDFITRAQWGADPVQVELGHPIDHKQVRGLIVHHDVISFDGHARDIIGAAEQHAKTLQGDARPDLGKEWPYSFGLAPDYNDPDHTIIVEGRGFGRTGAHTKDWNSTRYGVVLFGDYRTMKITPGQVRGARWLGAWLWRPDTVAITWGHHDAPHNATECPAVHGEELVQLAQPPFVPTDLSVFDQGAKPVSDTLPGINPPRTPPAARVVDELDDPDAGGAWQLFEDGTVWTVGTARFFGSPTGKSYWTPPNNVSRRLIAYRDGKGRNRYLVRNSHGADYGHDGF